MSNKEINSLDTTLEAVVKQFGTGAGLKMDNCESLATDIVSTGVLSLDNILGRGVPRGRSIELYGSPGVGKSSLALQIAANVCRLGGCVYLIDTEQSTYLPYLNDLGIPDDKFAISQPDTATEALSIAEIAAKNNVDMIIIDSVTALLCSQEEQGDFGDLNYGSLAKFMSGSLRKLCPVISNSGTIMCWVNQTRQKIGGYGVGVETTGGNALKFYSTQRLELVNIGQIKDGEEIIGSRVKIKVVKNKISKPFLNTELDLLFGRGFCRYGDVLDTALSNGIISKAGSWYSYNDMKLGQGRESVREALRDNVDLFNEIIAKVKEV